MTRAALTVVAAVIDDGDDNILIQQRTSGPFAGYWEFPGGKVEQTETLWAALVRELKEELDLNAQSGAPLLQSRHAYPDRIINLNVWRVIDWTGDFSPQEGQSVRWCPRDQLASANLLPADAPIITALQLPDYCADTPNLHDIASQRARAQFTSEIYRAVESHAIKILTLRQTTSTDSDYAKLAELLVKTVGDSCDVLLHGSPETRLGLINKTGAAGFNLHSSELKIVSHRAPEWKWLAASCRSGEELQQAARDGFDFGILGPVGVNRPQLQETSIGWERFSTLVSDVPLPVFASGGLTLDDLSVARHYGAQGVAATSEFWPTV